MTDQDKTSPQRLFTIADAARFLRLSIFSMRGIIRRHEIPIVRRTPRSKIFLDLVDLENWINAHSSKTASVKVLTEAEVEERYGLSVSQLQRWRKEGGGPPLLRIGRGIRYRPADIESYLEALKSTPDDRGGEGGDDGRK